MLEVSYVQSQTNKAKGEPLNNQGLQRSNQHHDFIQNMSCSLKSPQSIPSPKNILTLTTSRLLPEIKVFALALSNTNPHGLV